MFAALPFAWSGRSLRERLRKMKPTSTDPVGRSDTDTRAREPDETGVVERDGVRIHWERFGEGEQTILLEGRLARTRKTRRPPAVYPGWPDCGPIRDPGAPGRCRRPG